MIDFYSSFFKKLFRYLSKNPNIVILLCVYVYIVFILLNYENAWMMREILSRKAYILSNGSKIILQDLRRSLNWQEFEMGFPRCSRPLSSFFEIIDTKFRVWLWNYTVPHPSLSLTYIFSLLLSPLLLYKVFRNWDISPNTATGIVSIYIASPGLLSLVVMYFGPAKAMTNFSIILCMFLASRLNRSYPHNIPKNEHIGQFIILMGVMFISFFWDETALLIYPFLLIFFSRLVFKPSRLFIYMCIIPLAYTFYYSVIPGLTNLAGFPRPDLFTYDIMQRFLDLNRIFDNTGLFFRNTLINMKLLFMESLGLVDPTLMPFRMGRLLAFSNWIILAGLLSICMWAFFRKCFFKNISNFKKNLCFRFILYIVMLSIFHSYLLYAKNDHLVWGPYWYGAYFSVIFVLTIAALADLMKTYIKVKKSLLFMFNVLIVANLLYVFPFTNYAYKKYHLYPPADPNLIENVFRNEINRFTISKDYPKDIFERTKTYWSYWKQKDIPDSIISGPDLEYLGIELRL